MGEGNIVLLMGVFASAVMNYTEMESKVCFILFDALLRPRRLTNNNHQVREATNNEPWGASSTLMQEIANGTHH